MTINNVGLDNGMELNRQQVIIQISNDLFHRYMYKYIPVCINPTWSRKLIFPFVKCHKDLEVTWTLKILYLLLVYLYLCSSEDFIFAACLSLPL